MAKKGLLIDVEKCIACHACSAACKVKNNTPTEVLWTKVESYEKGAFPNTKEYNLPFGRCMHCEHPACASACPVAALRKIDSGPVVYDEKKCIGCRYCMTACPFNVPELNWGSLLPSVQKCNLCADRQAAQLQPACVSVCPTGALKFGDRYDLITEAKSRIRNSGGKYVNHVYGENEIGGTSLLYISAIPFKELGFPVLAKKPVTELSEQVVHGTPYGLGGLLVGLTAVYWIFNRREKLQNNKNERKP